MTNEKEREGWNDIVGLSELYMSTDEEKEGHGGHGGAEYHIMYLSLFDSAALISQKCFQVLKFTEEEAGNRTVGYHIEDHESFFLIEENHDVLYRHIEDLMSTTLDISKGYKLRMTYTAISIPVFMGVACTLAFTCVLCSSSCEMGRELKGLRLIPKDEAMKKSRQFGKTGIQTHNNSHHRYNTAQNSHGYNSDHRGGGGGMHRLESNLTGKLTNQTFQTLDPQGQFEHIHEDSNLERGGPGGGGGTTAATSIASRWSTYINKFWCYNMICVVFCVAILILFSTLSIVSMNEYHTRNLEYSAVSQLGVHSRHIHFVLTDLLYRDDSLHPGEEMLKEFEYDLDVMGDLFNGLRRGDDELGVEGFDYTRMEGMKHLLYENACEFEESDHFVVRLNCTSLSDVFLEYLECYERIISVLTIVPNISSSIRTDVEYDILKSQDYLFLKTIDGGICESEDREVCFATDDFNGLNHSLPGIEGILQSKLDAVLDFLRNEDDTATIVNSNGVYILLIIVLPFVEVLGFFILFMGSFRDMNQYLMTPRSLLYLLDDRVLLKHRLSEFLNGQVSRRKILVFQKHSERKEFVQLVQYSTYSIVVFFVDSDNLMIVFANKSAHELFGFSDGYDDDNACLIGGSLSHILTPQSIQVVHNWMKKMKKFRRWKKKEKRRKKKKSASNKNIFSSARTEDSFTCDDILIEEDDEEDVISDEDNNNMMKNNDNNKSGLGYASANGHNFRGELMGLTISGEEFRVLVDICYHADSRKFFCIIENIESSKKKEILREVEKQSEKTEKLLRNMLPTKIADLMKKSDTIEGSNIDICDTFKCVTAIFADIVGFTDMMENSHPRMVVRIVNGLFTGIDDLTTKYHIEKIKTIGDAYFCVCGLPTIRPSHATEAMRFGIALLEWIKEFNETEKTDIHMRIGMASGPVIAGVIGKKKWQYDVWGRTINNACRMEENGVADNILVSRSTYELVFDKFKFDRREVDAHGLGRVVCFLFAGLKKEGIINVGEEDYLKEISLSEKELLESEEKKKKKKKKRKKKKKKREIITEEEEEVENLSENETTTAASEDEEMEEEGEDEVSEEEEVVVDDDDEEEEEEEEEGEEEGEEEEGEG